jgi:hypothetical protein
MENENTNASSNKTSQQLQDAYLSSLNEKEIKAYRIAKSHLGMSFDLRKSNGFLEYVQSIQDPNKS